MQLYDALASGNCYKVRLFAALIGAELEIEAVNLAKNESRTAGFLRLNPRGQIPVLVDGNQTIWDSQAILVHLARCHGGADWFPEQTSELVAVMQWLAVAENEILYGLARARAVKLFGRPWDMEQSQALGRAGLDVLEKRLSEKEWLATELPTIADVACYPYVALAPEGDIRLEPYPGVLAWMGRIQALPGYIEMPGLHRVD